VEVSEVDFPETEADVEPTTAAALKRRIDAGESVTLLDTRPPAEFETWHVDGPTVETVNVPYTEFLDGFDPALVAELPADEPVVVTCAKGISSEFVAGVLREAGYEASNLADGMRGWARLYDHVDVELPSGTLVRQYQRPSSGCLAYMVVAGDTAAVIDPLRAFVDRYVADANTLGAEIAYVLDTHVHADHVSGLRELAAAAGATAVMSAAAVARGATYADTIQTVTDGDRLSVGDATLAVHATPGHTSGGVSYLVDDALVATGDTVFLDGVARPDLEAGADGVVRAAEQLHETLEERLLELPAETLVAPAHAAEDTTPRTDGAFLATVGELATSLELLGVDRETFVDRVSTAMPPRPANHEQIIDTNLGRASATDGEAFTMELGPNNCAASD
jgi:glyoxylase-like metal-dependent hydrolase (beta-lactamase superfamily II)/rhodanese-related sulfurtransferase